MIVSTDERKHPRYPGWKPTSIGLVITIITTVLGVIAAVIEKYKNKDLSGALSVAIDGYNTVVDLFDPAVPQTESQTEQLNNIPARTWKMSDEIYSQLYKQLTDGGAVNERGLRATIDLMESKGIVEYGIIVEDHDGNPDTTCDSAFICVRPSRCGVQCAAGAPVTAISN